MKTLSSIQNPSITTISTQNNMKKNINVRFPVAGKLHSLLLQGAVASNLIVVTHSLAYICDFYNNQHQRK